MRLSPQTIEKMSKEFDLISPFKQPYKHEQTNLSGGLSCAGYNVHLNELSIPKFDGKFLSNHSLHNNWEHEKKKYQEYEDELKTLEEDVKNTLSVTQGQNYQIESLSLEGYEDNPDQSEDDFKKNIDFQIKNIKESINSNNILFDQQSKRISDLKKFLENKKDVKSIYEKQYVIEPNAIVLGSTIEIFNIPKHISMTYFNNPTLAHRFIDSCATLGEPSWHGHLTIEIKNNSHVPIILTLGQPIGQVVFDTLDHPTQYPYNDKYQGQSSEPKDAE